MYRKMALGLTIAALGVGLLGCGGNGGGSGNGGNGADVGTDGKGDVPSAAAKVGFTIMGSYPSSNLSETDQLFIDGVEKATNTEIKFDIPPATGYSERMQLALTTGEYPEVVYFPTTEDATFLRAVKDGIILPVDEYLKSEENINKYSYPVSWDALKVNNDGKIYGIPRTSVIRSDGYWVRKDWLKKLNIELPADSELTLEQMTDILRKFTKDDPDGNGIADTYGYGSYAAADKTMAPNFTNEFGLYGWQETSGGAYKYMNPQYDLNSDLYTKALTFSAQLFHEGLMDPDAPTLNSAKALERFESGKTGVLYGFAGHYQMFTDAGRKVNPNFDLAYVFVKNEQGENKGLGTGTGLYGFWAVTKSAKDPQKIVDVFDYMLSDEGWNNVYNGMEGHDYTVENGKKVYPAAAPETFVRKNLVRRANDYMFFISPDMPEDLKNMIVPQIEKAVNRMVLSLDRDYTPAIAKTPEYLDFEKKFSEVTTKIIIGNASADEYKKVLQQWTDKFGEAYLKDMNDYIASMEAAK